MSGISGVLAFSPGAVALDALHHMAEALHHRGPDSSAAWLGPDIGLACSTLAIGGAGTAPQPVHSADGRWVVVLDGEISNRDPLRARLDYPFRTCDDAEVVVAGLSLEGISFIEQLHGQFALAAHDRRTRTTHLVRDRLGVLPLYYRHVPGGIVFASEVKALLDVGPRPEVDQRSLHVYLGSRVVPAPHTLFEGVKKVRAGHRVSIMPGAHLEDASYWAPPEVDPEGSWSVSDAIEAVGDGVREAVRSALVPDVPVGVHLATDLASSLLVAELQQLRGERDLHTYSVSFDAAPHGHLERGRRLSKLLGTEHHDVRLRASEFEDLWSRLTWHRETPIADPADVAAFGVARRAQQDVRMVLSGVGHDAMFDEHPASHLTRLAARYPMLPPRVHSHAADQTRLGPAFTPAERERLLGTALPRDREPIPPAGSRAHDRTLRTDVRSWLPDHVLETGDRLFMAGSVAWRPALMDHRLVELVLRLPASLKLRSRSSRWLLQEAARPLLPHDVVDERTHAPRVPLDTWFSAGLHETARDWLTASDSWVAASMDRATVHGLVERRHGRAHEDAQLWTLMGLESWHRTFFGAPPAVPRPRSTPSVDAVIRAT